MFKLLIVAAALTLSACAAQVVSSNSKQVLVYSEMMDTAGSQKLADTECQRQNKVAVLSVPASHWDRHYAFICVSQ